MAGPPQADDARTMQEAYAGDVAKANRDAEMNNMKEEYTRRWVAETTTLSSAKPSTSNWTWSTTSSEVSASSSRHSGGGGCQRSPAGFGETWLVEQSVETMFCFRCYRS